jgi:hypothetical protein
MNFEILGELRDIEVIAVGRKIRELSRPNRGAIACPSFPPRPVLRERVGVRVLRI